MPYNKTDAAAELGISKSEFERRAKAAGFDNTEQYYWSLGHSAAGSSGEYANTGTFGGGGMNNPIIQSMQNKIASFTPINTMYQQYAEGAGLPQLTSFRQTLGQTIEDIPENVRTSAQQFGMSKNRIAQRIEGRLGKLAPTYQKAVTQEQQARGDVEYQLKGYLDQINLELMPYGTAAQIYTADLKAQTDRYLQKLANESALELAEVYNLAKLAEIEAQAEADMEVAAYKDTLTGGAGTQDTGWLMNQWNLLYSGQQSELGYLDDSGQIYYGTKAP